MRKLLAFCLGALAFVSLHAQKTGLKNEFDFDFNMALLNSSQADAHKSLLGKKLNFYESFKHGIYTDYSYYKGKDDENHFFYTVSDGKVKAIRVKNFNYDKLTKDELENEEILEEDIDRMISKLKQAGFKMVKQNDLEVVLLMPAKT